MVVHRYLFGILTVMQHHRNGCRNILQRCQRDVLFVLLWFAVLIYPSNMASPFYNTSIPNIQRCRKLCQYQRDCKGINYNVRKRTCELFKDLSGRGTREPRSDEVFEVLSQNQTESNVQNVCLTRPCGSSEFCALTETNLSGFMCIYFEEHHADPTTGDTTSGSSETISTSPEQHADPTTRDTTSGLSETISTSSELPASSEEDKTETTASFDIQTTSSPGCPANAVLLGYEYNAALKICYRVGTEDDSWDNHNQICLTEGGHLLLVKTKAVNDWLATLYATKYNALDAIHIDGTDVAVEGTFRDHAGNLLTWTSWSVGQPNDRYDIYNCIWVVKSRAYGWSDGMCNTSGSTNIEGYICQIDV